MPLYDFRCEGGHTTERLLTAPVGAIACPECGKDAERRFPLPHVPPDGVYSYAPNIGDPRAFERKHEEAKQRGKAA